MVSTAAKVFAPGPDRVTGGVLANTLGTSLPTSLDSVLSGWTDYGYVTEDGLSLTQDISWEKIKEWGGDTVRRIMSDFTGTFSFTFLETSSQTAGAVFGDDNVVTTANTSTLGNRMTIKGNANEGARKSWVFRMKDGPRRMMIVVPDGQITDRGDVSFTKSGALTWSVTLETAPDADGNSFYIYTDDGITAVTAAPILTSILPSGAATGANVTIKGDRFTGVTGITFGGTAAPNFQIVDDDNIVVAVPTGTAGSVNVVVTNPSGPSASRSYTRA